MHTSHDLPAALTFDSVIDWFFQRADAMYGGEAVTQLEHALQCAALAQAAGASASLITAALLHDIGHLAQEFADVHYPHEKLAADLLRDVFGAAVLEPIWLHVDAKRYLCAIDSDYRANLSPASTRSLEWQGGAFSPSQAEAFITKKYASDAVLLRHWDDAAKIAGATVPSLRHYFSIMQMVLRPTAYMGREAA
jgi:phosphonate degradation associated HDIG domain protein